MGRDIYGHLINTGNTQLDHRGKALQPYKEGQKGYSIQYGINQYNVYTNAYGKGGQKFSFTSTKAANDFIKRLKKEGYPWSGLGGVGDNKFIDRK